MAKTEPPSPRFPVSMIFATCCWLALAGGLTELTILWARRANEPMLPRSEDYVWTVPLALILVVVVAVLPFVLAGLWRPQVTSAVALFVAAAVVFLDVLMLIPRLSHYAAALLAAGLATQVARLVLRNTERTRRIVLRSTPGLLVLLLLVGLTIWVSRPTQETAPSAVPRGGPNVLFITLDTVRAANLSLYGYRRETTPNLSRFAERGVVFDRAFSVAPWTLPSHASLFTGRWPHELSVGYYTPLDGSYPTLAEYFAARGYATAGFVANLAYCSRDTGLARGFQHYEDYPRSLGQFASNSTLLRNVADNFKLRRLIQNDEHLNRVTAPEINERVLAWLSRQRDVPFFAFLNYFDAHEPYLPPLPFDRQFGSGREHKRHSPLHHALWNPAVPYAELDPDALREEVDAYDGSLTYLDSQLGRLLDELATRQLLDRTLVVITSDHGEEFAEHRVPEHGYSLYRAALQVPLVMVLPGRVPSSRRLQTPVSLRDVAATIVDIAGDRDAAAIPGESLSSLWKGAESDVARQREDIPLLAELARPSGQQPQWFPVSKGDMYALLYRGRRYIRNGDLTEELYDLETDPWERRNLAAGSSYHPILAEARARLAIILAGGERPRQE